jgi:Fuc2NAc and GlcNAc transferase
MLRRDLIPENFMWALGGGGLAVALVGMLDDRGGVNPAVRLAVHVGAASWAVMWLGGMPGVRVASTILDLGLFGDLLAVVAIVWTLNLFNFMDGIDGIAASEAVFISVSAAAMAFVTQDFSTMWPLIVLAGSCLGFLILNWPPAKIFMGDIGSGFVGFVIGVCAIFATEKNPSTPFIWLILGGVFFVDATLTLLVRFSRREHVFHAHRSHAYQKLTRRWGTHRRVTGAVLLFNTVWLLPWSLIAFSNAQWASWCTLAALTPLTVLAVKIAAGKPDQKRGNIDL